MNTITKTLEFCHDLCFGIFIVFRFWKNCKTLTITDLEGLLNAIRYLQISFCYCQYEDLHDSFTFSWFHYCRDLLYLLQPSYTFLLILLRCSRPMSLHIPWTGSLIHIQPLSPLSPFFDIDSAKTSSGRISLCLNPYLFPSLSVLIYFWFFSYSDPILVCFYSPPPVILISTEAIHFLIFSHVHATL